MFDCREESMTEMMIEQIQSLKRGTVEIFTETELAQNLAAAASF